MKVIVTGSFDPITLGHLELVKYASENYDTVYVVALVNEAKSYMFTMEQKKRLIEISVKDYKNVIADAYVGMTADYMHKHGITKIIRGVRNDVDRAYELELAEKMKEFDSNFETVIINCDSEKSHISSTLVRSIIENNGSLDELMSEEAIEEIKKYISERK